MSWIWNLGGRRGEGEGFLLLKRDRKFGSPTCHNTCLSTLLPKLILGLPPPVAFLCFELTPTKKTILFNSPTSFPPPFCAIHIHGLSCLLCV